MPQTYRVLGELDQPYRHIYLSPHLDDAALSCGGAIASYTAAGEAVLVVNICTAAPDPNGPFSPFAAENHQRWGLGPAEVVSRRLAEDQEALEMLGADGYQLGMLDAIYRMPERYNSDATLFGTPAPDDALARQLIEPLASLAQRFPEAIVYGPLAVGNHVDHQATYSAARALVLLGISVAFYEDIPYATLAGALDERLRQLGGPANFMSSTLHLDAFLQRKIGAVECYGSQIGALFGDAATMAQRIAAYAEGLRPEGSTYGERIWIAQ